MKENYYNYEHFQDALDFLRGEYQEKINEYNTNIKERHLKTANKIKVKIDKIIDKNNKFIKIKVCKNCLVFAACDFHDINCDKFDMYLLASDYIWRKRHEKLHSNGFKNYIVKNGNTIVCMAHSECDKPKGKELKFHKEMVKKIKSLPYYNKL